jgi:hypothetical protein
MSVLVEICVFYFKVVCFSLKLCVLVKSCVLRFKSCVFMYGSPILLGNYLFVNIK